MTDKQPKSGAVVEREGTGELNVYLHPLVLINMSDHWIRTRVQNNVENPRVIGALLGLQTGRNIEIMNSFELVYDVVDKRIIIEPKYLTSKQEQFKKVFPTYDFLGWYSTGDSAQASDMDIQRSQTMLDFNESPLYLVLDPIAAGRKQTKELPVTIYESLISIVNEQPTWFFVKVPYKIETGEAERIAVDHVAKINPTGSSADGSLLAAHLLGVHNAIYMLSVRIKLLTQYLEAVKSGKAPKDHGVLRKIGALCNQLPAIDTQPFRKDFVNEYNDALMIAYLASITKGTSAANELIEKFNVTYERHARSRRPF